MELECKGYIKRENKVFSFFKKYWVNVITVILCIACCFVSITQTKGIQGEQGIQGLQGIQGIQGERGEQGERGIDGVSGKDGIDGKDGKDGVDGINGKDGINGINGLNGKDGKDGIDGVNGKDGLTPHVGSNGNWWVGNTDTGTKAQATTSQIIYAYPDIHTLKNEDFVLEAGRVYENVLFSHSGGWLRLYHKDGDTVIKTTSSGSGPGPEVYIGTIKVVGEYYDTGRFEFSFTDCMLLTDYIVQNYTN